MNTPASRLLRAITALSATAALGLTSAYAASDSWNTQAGLWSANGSWLSGTQTPGATSGTTSTDIATFAFTLGASRIVTVDANRNIGGITFGANNTAFTYTLSGGNLLLTNGGVIQVDSTAASSTGDFAISSAIAIQGDGGSATFTNNGFNGRDLAFSGAVSGVSTSGNTTTLTLNGTNVTTTVNNVVSNAISDGVNGGKLALTKSGTGSWALTGANANTYTGLTTVENGLLQLNKTAGIDAIAGGGLKITGGIVEEVANNQINDAAQVEVSGGIWRNTTVRTETVGTVLLNGGSINANSTSNTFTITASTLDLRSGTVGNGVILGGAALNKNTAGALVLNNTNTFSSVAITDGVVSAGKAGVDLASGGSLGTGAVTVGTTGRLDSTVANALIGNSAITINSGGELRGITTAGTLNTGTGVKIGLNGGTVRTQGAATIAFGGNLNVTANSTVINERTGAASSTSMTQSLGTLDIGAFTLNAQSTDNQTGGTSGITFGATTLSGNATFNVTNNNAGTNTTNLTLGAVGGGAFGITKTGNGTLTFGSANTYTGATNVSAGTLTISNASSFTNTSAINLSDTGRLNVNVADADLSRLTSPTGTGVVAGTFLRYSVGQTAAAVSPGTIAGTLEINGVTVANAHTFAAGSAITATASGGVLGANNTANRINITGDTTINLGSFGLALQSPINSSLSTADVYVTGSSTLGFGSTNTANVALKTSTFRDLYIGTGATVEWRSSSTIGSSDTALGTGTVRMATGSLLNFNVSGDPSNALSNNIELQGNATIKPSQGSGRTTQLLGVISGASKLTLTLGAQTTTLGGNNTFSGGLDLSLAGTSNSAITASGTGALGSGVVNFINSNTANTTVTLGANQSVAGLVSTFTNTGIATISGNSATAPANTRVLTLNNTAGGAGDNASFSGVIGGATAAAQNVAVTKLGTGTQTLSGVNSYTGATTVNAGKLSIASTGTINGTSGVSIGAGEFNYNNSTALTPLITFSGTGGTLSGNGTVGAFTLTSGNTISPGNSPGTLTTGAETWSNGGNYNWQIVDANGAAGTGYDTIAITSGGLNLVGLTTNFNINLWSLSGIGPDVNGNATNFNNTQNYTWTLVSNTGNLNSTVGSVFTVNVGANNGTTGFSNALGGGSFSVVGTSNSLDLVFTAALIPEPSTYAALAGALALGLASLRRRRRAS